MAAHHISKYVVYIFFFYALQIANLYYSLFYDGK